MIGGSQCEKQLPKYKVLRREIAMVEQGGRRASWQKAFQPLQNGVALALPSILYKLLAKASTILLTISKISP